MNNDDFDIMGNVRLIENYKTYMLSSVADLFVTMSKGNRASMDDIKDEISEIIILSYLLSKRLNIEYPEIDDRIIKKLKLGVVEDNSVEKEYGDYSKLIHYIKNERVK